MRTSRIAYLLLFFGLTLAAPVDAYIGPGAGAGTIAVVLGILASIFMGFFAILWYPFKRMLKKRGTRQQSAEAPAAERSEG